MSDTYGITRLSDKPAPFWLVRLQGAEQGLRPPFNWVEFVSKLDENLVLCEFRGVSARRLNSVLRNGIDVDPTDSPIFAGDLDKAWQYGEFPKLILALNASCLQQTFRIISSDISTPELQKLRERYPTVDKSQDGSMLRLSRFPESSRYINTNDEIRYAWWIEGDPFNALRAIMLFARPEDDMAVTAFLKAQKNHVQK